MAVKAKTAKRLECCEITSKVLTNGELDELVEHYKIKNYHGCFIDDKLPKKLRNGYYVVNLNGHSHWTCLLKDGNKYFYFDSYGFFASEEVEDQIGEYIYSTDQLQDMNSSSCGYYCIAWMQNRVYLRAEFILLCLKLFFSASSFYVYG